jgi:hypothetical protein
MRSHRATGPATTYSPAAVSNITADKVDGKHAVGAGARIRQRREKLAATDRYGFLPRNASSRCGAASSTSPPASPTARTMASRA